MDIQIAKNSGFCFGVSRSIELAESELNNSKLFSYGPLIHNNEVIKNLESKGLIVSTNFEEFNSDSKIIIRAHGISKLEYDKLDNTGIKIIDGTCPFVTKIHKIVSDIKVKDDLVLIVGNPKHPEVKGIVGHCIGEYVVIEDISSLDTFEADLNRQIIVVVQTTFDQNKFAKIIEKLTEKGYHIKEYDTICSATKNRQDEALNLSKNVDIMLVIGDKQSSNTIKLYELCLKNCSNTYLIQTVKDIDNSWFENMNKVGITAGASSPKYIIEEVQDYVRTKF